MVALFAVVIFVPETGNNRPLKSELVSNSFDGSTQSFYIDVPISSINSVLFSAGQYYGCAVQTNEPQNEFVNLNFGPPLDNNGTWGTYDWAGFISDNEIINAVANYINGWYSCGYQGHFLTVLVNTNDSGYFSTYVSDGAGTNWADVINEINNWSLATYSNFTYGSDDFEPGFCACQSSVDSWINQYTTTAQLDSLIGFGGSADGCYGNQTSLYYYPNAQNSSCSYGFSALGLFDIIDANGHGFVEPQQYNQSLNNVYDTNDGQYYQLEPQAVQYSNILNYGYQVRNGEEPLMWGTMTQVSACNTHPACSGEDNSPATAWGQMWNALAYGNNQIGSDEITYGLDNWYSGTDMAWLT